MENFIINETINSRFLTMETNIKSKSNSYYDSYLDLLEGTIKYILDDLNIQYDKILKRVNDKNLVLFGGEDFGLLIAVSKQDSKILDNLNVPKIGVVTDTKKIIVDNVEIVEDKSFNHF